ncbi:MAG: hypothetical protein ACI857_001946 [Arenicella sp.]|jgi:hypothetical protein
MLPGNWMGIEMYQDDNSYDGENIFLPNEEFMVISSKDVKIYFYPYSKSDEFDISITEEELVYTVGKRKLKTSYSFTNKNCDTLVFTMNFINKSFKKMFSRVTSINERMEVDFATINELDTYGFNPSSITSKFELDTFHTEFFTGFKDLDSLKFKPYKFLEFLSDKEMTLDKEATIAIDREYKMIKFKWDGREELFLIDHCEGTQSFKIVPVSLCSCENIVLPYISVEWADRIRQDMKDNPYKYRD